MPKKKTSENVTVGITPVALKEHEHAHCIDDAINTAEAYCKNAKLRFTPIRRKVLEILAQEHRAIGAYAILERLRENGFGSQPPLAYRALEFLMKHGLAHKVERLNAFISCTHPTKEHSPAFLICRTCSSVAETTLDAAKTSLGGIARAANFRMEGLVMESEGLCFSCSRAAT